MRIKCGDPEDLYSAGQQCRSCGALDGEIHRDGCSVERCSERHRYEDGSIQQALSCTECWAEDERTFLAIAEGLK